MDSELKKLQLVLFGRIKQLSEKMNAVTDSETAKQILFEMHHRVTLIGNMIFNEQSNALGNQIINIETAAKKLDEAIESKKEIAERMNIISDFLALIDEAIELADLTTVKPAN